MTSLDWELSAVWLEAEGETGPQELCWTRGASPCAWSFLVAGLRREFVSYVAAGVNPKPCLFVVVLSKIGWHRAFLTSPQKKMQGDTVPVRLRCQQLLWCQGRGICGESKR